MPTNEYMKQYMKNRRILRRDKLIEMSGSKCARCGNRSNLEFNHKDRKTKLFDLSGSALDKSWSKILEELEKCELLCKCCHGKYTATQYETKEITVWNAEVHGEYVHGTMRTYNELNCRCSECKLAKKLYRNKMVTYNELVQSP